MDFHIENDKVYIECRLSLVNNSDESKKVGVVGIFDEDVKNGLLTESTIRGVINEGPVSIELGPHQEMKNIEVVFVGTHGVNDKKANKNLPELNIIDSDGLSDKNVITVNRVDWKYEEDKISVSVDDLNNLQIGDDLDNIEDKIGQPDTWTGSGILWPVYFLKDRQYVVLTFDANSYKGLNKVILYDSSGRETVIKSK